MSPQDQLADAPEKLRILARVLDARRGQPAEAESLVEERAYDRVAGLDQASDDLCRWADAIEAERHTPAVEAWKFVLGVSLGMVAAFLWGWIAAGGQL